MLLYFHNFLYTSSFDGTLKKWSLNTLECLKIQKCEIPNFYLHLILMENLNCIIALTNHNEVHIINCKTIKVIKIIAIPWK
jgi:hypothetical protein